ncbi:MAG: TolC family protein [Proteiniphilum sp.]
MKRYQCLPFMMLSWFSSLSLTGQTVKLSEMQQKAASHYPAIARYEIIEKSKQFDLANASKAFLPQGTLSAQATWQSDVTRFDLEWPEGMPPLEIPVPDQEQYRVVAELSQLIWDGGSVSARKKSLEAGAAVEQQQLEAEIYALRERVNNLFFGILVMQEHLRQQEILEKELQRSYNNVESYLQNGVANEADLSTVKVEQLKAGQQRISMESTLEAYLKMLSVLAGDSLHAGMTFLKPEAEMEPITPVISRPELQLFSAQEQAIESQRKLLKAGKMPKLGAFAQGGYGKPGLNMFDNQFSPYFLGGVRLTWNIGSLYTWKNKEQQIDLQKQAVAAQRETFLHNLSVQIPQQQMEIEKFRKTMQDDEEIIRHQTLIRKAAEVKVAHGTMSVSELMQAIHAEETAKRAKTLHEIQYLLSLYALKHTTNE